MKINPFRVLLVAATIVLLSAIGVQAQVVPYINDFGLLSVASDADGRGTLIPNGGLGVINGYAYSEISTYTGTFVRVPALTLKSSHKFVGLRNDDNYWSFVFIASEDGESRLIQVTTPTYTIGGAVACDVSPCVPATPYYSFAVIVHRPSASLTYVESK